MVRIVAGTARGRKLETPEGLDTRPTLDRVKEAAMGSLQFRLAGSRVLDLFSGSGNLGIEALSRGASFAVFNDYAQNCASIIRQNVQTLGFSERALVWNLDYAAALKELSDRGERFDIVFLDAPYRNGLGEQAARKVLELGLLKEDGVLYLEYATDEPPKAPFDGMRIYKEKRCGACSFVLMEREEQR